MVGFEETYMKTYFNQLAKAKAEGKLLDVVMEKNLSDLGPLSQMACQLLSRN